MNRKAKFIVVYPYPFGDFVWHKLELDQLSDDLDVEVWDLSKFLNKNFAKNIHVKNSGSHNIREFNSFKSLVRILIKTISQAEENKVYFLYQVPTTNSYEILVKIMFLFIKKRKKYVVIETLNPGLPLISRDTLSEKLKSVVGLIKFNNMRSFRFYFRTLIFSKFNNLLPALPTHAMVSGTEYETIYKTKMQKKVKIIKVHSIDFNEYVRVKNLKNFSPVSDNQSAFLLDSPDPYYLEDRVLTGSKSYLTSKVWYPLLNDFLDCIEHDSGVKVSILGHYKTDFTSPSALFGNRHVIYNRTLECVAKSKFVITRASAAVSFAVIFRKPILFIFSDELTRDKHEMAFICKMAEELGTEPININQSISKLDDYLRVDEAKYEIFEKKFLTSANLDICNYQIILKEII